MLTLFPGSILALGVFIPNVDVPVGCYPNGRFIYHMYGVVLITGLETNAEYYITRDDNFFDVTPPVSIVQLLYSSGQDRIVRDDFEITGYNAGEGFKYRYLGTNDTAFFDYNFEILNEDLVIGESTNKPGIRIRKVNTLDSKSTRSIITIKEVPSTITGPALTCNGSASYILQDPPEGTNVNWSIKQNNTSIAQGTGTTASTNNLNNGSVEVEFEIIFPCNLDPVTVQDSFWSGVPAAPTIYPSSPIYESINSVFYVSITDSPGADPSTGYWETYGCVSPNGTPSGSIAAFFSCNNNGCGTIYISTSNNCGTLYRTALTVLTGSGGDCGELPERAEPSNLIVSPNPASDYVELNIDSKKPIKVGKLKVEIYNVYFNLVRSFFIFSTKEKINISDIPKGNYVIIVHDGNFSTNGKLIIQR